MKTRVVTSVVSILLFFAIFFAPDIVFYTALAIIAGMMLFELLRAVGADKCIYVICYINAVVAVLGMFTPYMTEAILAIIAINMGASVFMYGKHSVRTMYIGTVLSLFTALFMSCIAKIKSEFGNTAVLIVFVSAWMTDIGGFFGGKFFGKHKLSPLVSPKKTVEGSVGGILLSVVFNLLYAMLINSVLAKRAGFNADYVKFAVLGVTASIAGQIGDLSASVIKREHKIKDYGNIFPGHGGVMDRFDSVVFIAPVVYYLMKYFITAV